METSCVRVRELCESERQVNLAVGKVSVIQHFEEYRQGREDGDLEEYKVRTDLLQATFSACSIQDKTVDKTTGGSYRRSTGEPSYRQRTTQSDS